MKRVWSLLMLLVMILTTSVTAQTKLPADQNVRIGTLPNGLTYYIRHNEQPKGRADFHIAQAVGAILEEDNQNGLAHFLEHMAFNGTKHFPDKDLINYFELNGVNFGGNINAYTSLDETVYRLSDVPTAREGLVDSALLVMHDWAVAISLIDAEIDNERGVIREEWRTGANAMRRMWRESNKIKYAGSQYAKRDVIGDTAVINNFTYQALRDYYHKWYGPDLQAIVVVGDIDPDAIEEKIKSLFMDVPARQNRGERPIYTLPANTNPIVSIVQDAEAQQTRIEMEFKHEPLSPEYRLSVEGYNMGILNRLVSSIMGYRFEEITAKPDASFIAAYVGYGELNKSTDALRAIAIPKDGQETKAMEDMMIQLEKLDRYGVTNAELERAKTELLTSFEKSFNERNNVKNITYAREYIRNYLDNEPIPGIETEYEIVKALMPMVTTTMLNELVSNQITEENMIISFMAPEKEGIKLPDAAQAVDYWKSVQTAEIAAPVEETITRNLVDKAPKAGKIKKVTQNASLGTTEWLLSNGVKVVIKPTTFKQDEILMTSYSAGGYSLVSDIAQLPSAVLACDVVEANGIGDFSYIDLQKVLTGKRVSLTPSMSQYSEGMRGSSTVKDLETLLQLIYLYQNSPRQDDESYAALMSMLQSALANRDSNPKQAFYDSIQTTMSCHNPRTILFDLNTLTQVNQQTALQIYKERFSNAADFTFFFTGNIDPNDKATQKLICTWLGGMKTNKSRETWKDDGIRMPKGIVVNMFTRDMQINTASNRIVYNGTMAYTMQNRLVMRAISDILSIRYLESIREKEGGSYGVGTSGYVSDEPIQQAVLLMQFDTDPDKQERLVKIIHKEVDDILRDGPRADDLQKVKESMLKDFEENIETNNYWQRSILSNYYLNHMNYVESYCETVRNITPEVIVGVLSTLVSQGNIAEIVMMPAY